ncbi:MFS transporter [Nocardia sp. NPDC051030]|uniref:MFS transporter n=1 Tax=Nocardia sp. NPDC051030 TaxID=3155162 RepID=UPI00341760B0
MAAATPAPPLRQARAALFAVFGLNGMLSAIWIVHIPAVTERTGVSHTTLGMLILFMAGSAIVGMQAAGPLADRLGSRALTALTAAVVSVSMLGLGFATSPVTLAIALAFYGFGTGSLDVSMNAQAVHVERAYRRPIMSAFHAFFSCGGLLGSLAGAATQHADWNLRLTFALATVIGLAVVAIGTPRLLPHTPHTPSVSDSAVAQGKNRWVSRKVLILGMIAFALLMAEGVAADWSALQMRDRLSVADATAGLAFAAVSFTMTVGRFAADRVSGRIGSVAVVRWGTLVAAAGFALIVVSGWTPLTLAGWALCGVGLSGCVPQVFTAAGNLGSATAATDMSRVFGLGYVGLLAGPAIIGWLTKAVSLTTAMVVPLIAMALCALAARAVAAPVPDQAGSTRR